MTERQLTFTRDGERVDLTPENAILLRYTKKIGETGIRASMYDHIQIVDKIGGYGWLDPHGEEYAETVQRIMVEDDFVVMLNMPEPSEEVIEQYNKHNIAPELEELEQGVPEDWV